MKELALPAIDFAPGSCLLVGTPIGNLDDMTLRGLAALAAADVIFAEDTRRTRKLLSRYGLTGRLASYHDHSEERTAPRVIERLRAGERVAVVSDAGMPAISDPGYVLIRALREAGLPWSVVPGPSSVLTALVLSGLPTDRFLFVGYPPRRPGRLRMFCERLLAEPGTVVVLEAVHRIQATLRQIAELAPQRELAIVREISKLHEEVVRGTPAELLELMTGPRLRGELVLVVRGAGGTAAAPPGAARGA